MERARRPVAAVAVMLGAALVAAIVIAVAVLAAAGSDWLSSPAGG